MATWNDNIDPATIPHDVLKSEWARRSAAKRKNPSGGRNGGRPVCACGTCKSCKLREEVAALFDRGKSGAGALPER